MIDKLNLFPERDQSKPAEQQGLFRKFDVRRVDGSDQPGGKHYGCRYYVLDLNHDQHAPAAMRAYAAACRATHPQLAADIEAEFGAAPAKPQEQPVAAQQQDDGQLDQIEQYRLQMAAISTAALGYWKIGDPIKDEYVTVALKDVAKLYEKYNELFKAAQQEASAPAQAAEQPIDEREAFEKWLREGHGHKGIWNAWQARAALAASHPQAAQAQKGEQQ